MNPIFYIFDWRRNSRKFNPTMFAGAGNVNWWGQSNPRTETAKLAAANIPCLHIELFGWADGLAYEKHKAMLKKLKTLLFWCKRRNLTLFVSVCNDNAHLAKYGNTPTDIGKYKPQITEALKALAKAAKKQGVYVQPVGETQTAAGRWVEAEAAAIIDRRWLVSNGSGGRPSGVPAWATYIAWHKAKVTDKAPAGAWDVTDHGTMLTWLGGTYAQAYSNANIRAWATVARDNGSPAILYGFQQKKMDRANLKTLAEAYYK